MSLRVVTDPDQLGHPDLVILPGSKSTVSDLAWLHSTGLAAAILAAREWGSALMGICGGYQMLGVGISDPAGVEGGAAAGLGLLEVTTTFQPAKVLARREARVLPVAGLLAGARGMAVSGYEIHMGTVAGAETRPALELGDATDGAVSTDGWVVGTSLHGLLADSRFRRTVLEALAERKGVELPPPPPQSPDPYDAIADALEWALDIRLLDRIIGVDQGRGGERTVA